jgi:hypothetical protein
MLMSMRIVGFSALPSFDRLSARRSIERPQRDL